MKELRERLSVEMQAVQSVVTDYDGAVAVRLGVNRTDLRCIEILQQRGAVSPSELGVALGLTTGSVTAMLDRLEKLGYLTRSPDPNDRRKVVVRVAPEVSQRAYEFYGAIAEEGAELIAPYSEEELTLIADFLRGSRELYERNLARLRTAPPAKRARAART
ncbi:MAG TPA: MarR family transcriptional regulator [Streptosporangiaceae bacterium]